jgi:hypothetical protein
LAAGLLCGLPIALGLATLLWGLHGAFQRLPDDGDFLIGLLSLCCTPCVVGALTYRALGRPKKEALGFVGCTVTLATAIYVALAVMFSAMPPATRRITRPCLIGQANSN